MRQKMPVRVRLMVVIMVVLVFYIPIIVLTMDTLVSVGYLVATLGSLVGTIANFVVVTANNWQMPVRFSFARDTRHCAMTDATRFNWLGDRFVLFVPYNMLEVSIGDICLIFGILFFLIFFSIHIVGKIM